MIPHSTRPVWLESAARALESDAIAQNWFATGAGFGIVLARYDVDGLGWALFLGASTALTSIGIFALRRRLAADRGAE